MESITCQGGKIRLKQFRLKTEGKRKVLCSKFYVQGSTFKVKKLRCHSRVLLAGIQEKNGSPTNPFGDDKRCGSPTNPFGDDML